MMSKNIFKKIISNGAKFAISIILMAFVIRKAHFSKILEELSHTSTYHVVAAFVIFIFTTIFLSVRWKIITRPLNGRIPLWIYFKYFLYSYFFNNFLPTSIGGDIIRALKIKDYLEDRSHGFASVLVDRLLGILATLTYATVGLYFTANLFKSGKIVYFAIVFSGLVALLLFILFNYTFYMKIRPGLLKITVLRIGERLCKLIEAVHVYKSNKMLMFYGYILSMLAQGSMVIINYYLLVGLGYQPSLGYLFFAIPVSFLVTLFPSINGLGIRDWSYVVLFSRIGIPVAASVSVAFLVVTIQIVLSLFGGILWLFEKENPKMETIEEAAEEL
ncbi:MAG: lysylphosphatidylglycerol synthase transmembrane domain-containing protein [Calditrichia bacterium]